VELGRSKRSITTDSDGATTSELFYMVTNLPDPEQAPIEDIPALYHQRWTGERPQ
jgi:hypothetical protein